MLSAETIALRLSAPPPATAYATIDTDARGHATTCPHMHVTASPSYHARCTTGPKVPNNTRAAEPPSQNQRSRAPQTAWGDRRSVSRLKAAQRLVRPRVSHGCHTRRS
ncbi:hypothetical protein PENSPDRAFT_173692 [Peniophora sp. CONT]|nr:hypothetical protein PENSPDRAFT_173692 [Peniophora sp. CONT]